MLAFPITNSTSVRSFLAHFGIHPSNMCKLWLLVNGTKAKQCGFSAVHLLWTLFFLKSVSSSVSVIVAKLQCDERTFWRWVTIGLQLVANRLPKVFITFRLHAVT